MKWMGGILAVIKARLGRYFTIGRLIKLWLRQAVADMGYVYPLWLNIHVYWGKVDI